MYIGIKSFHSSEQCNITLTDDVEVAVCTFERANVIITDLLSKGKESRLTMIVIDEIHMLADKVMNITNNSE